VSQRTWFTLENSQICNLHRADLIILNRAARNLWRPGHEPRQSDLATLRQHYKPGMSAADLIEEVAGALP
jgi:hypothetical protein